MPSALPRKLLTGILIFLAACSPARPQSTHQAAPPGTPQSLEFGHGARIEMNDPRVETSLRLAAQNGLDWVALDFDWKAIQPAPDAWNEASSFSDALRLAHSLGLETLVSVKNPPAWALNATGPDLEQTARLVLKLSRGDSLPSAIELFPNANTISGWNAPPDANAYARLFESTQARLEAENLKIYLVAGGLSNLLSSSEDVRDVDFLGQLYAAGLRPAIISVRFESMTSDPLAAPAPDSLRHYEEIRAVMTANNHSDGLLWITGLSLPAETEQTPWLEQAYPMMKSQLYLGAVFYSQPNLDARLLKLIQPNH